MITDGLSTERKMINVQRKGAWRMVRMPRSLLASWLALLKARRWDASSRTDVFPGAESEWSGTGTVTKCGSLGYMLGGYNVLGGGASVSKTFATPSPHTHLRVTFDFFKVDSWDNERAYLYVDNARAWDSGPLHYSAGTNICGAAATAWKELPGGTYVLLYR